ncbi:MAG TPA: hypothetical protein VIJ54_09930, partial [Actinomycetes bacterium]
MLTRVRVPLVAVVLLGIGVAFTAPAGATTGLAQPTLVSAVPSSPTPNVNNGTVLAIIQIGTRIVVGGSFTTVSPPGVTNGTQAVTRKSVFAFNAATGAIDTGFAPVLDGMVEGFAPGPSPDTVYVGGYFSNVNGVKSKGITLLSTVTGTVVPGFKPAALDGAVWSIVPALGHLVIGGTFTKIGSAAHSGIGSLNPTTGAIDTWMGVQLTGHHNYNGVSGSNAAVGARRMDVNPGASRLIVVGNFKNAGGALHDQIVLIDLGTTAVIDPNWNTAGLSATCASTAYDTYARDVAFAPDGSYFVVANTGGGGKGALNVDGTRALCDSASRWEIGATGADVQPTWVDYTGNDSFESVTTTGSAIYVGGHQRWVNNSLGSDSAGAGAVPRPGLVALDPASGIPFSWNPGRNPRGAGAYALLATPQGLYVGSDTTWIGNKTYYRGRIAGFALAGGEVLPSTATGSLAKGTVYIAGPGSSPASTLVARAFNGSTVGATTTVDTTTNWSQVRGAFMVGPWLYYGWSDGKLYRRTFDGTTLGAASLVDPYDDPFWQNIQTGSGQTYASKPPTLYGTELQGVTGMVYSAGRLYYSRSGKANLYWRWFNPESGIVGATETATTGSESFANADGMFLSGTTLYWTSKTNGALHSVAWAGGSPSSATDHVVSGPP